MNFKNAHLELILSMAMEMKLEEIARVEVFVTTVVELATVSLVSTALVVNIRLLSCNKILRIEER